MQAGTRSWNITFEGSGKIGGITLSTNKYAPAPKFYEKNGFVNCEHVMFMAKSL